MRCSCKVEEFDRRFVGRDKPWPAEDDPVACEREREIKEKERGGFKRRVELVSTSQPNR